MDQKSVKNGSNVKKKPEIQYYRPGQGIAAKRPEAETVANQKFESSEENKQIKCDHKLESKQTQNDNKTNNNGKSIGKKPDIKVYVPPKQTTNASNNSDKCEDKQSQRPVNNNERKTNTRSELSRKSDRSERRHKTERTHKNERNERTDKQEKPEKSDRIERRGRQEKTDRQELRINYEKNKNEKPVNERVERRDRSDRRGSEPKGKAQTEDQSADRHTSENFTKIKTFERTCDESDKSPEIQMEVIRQNNRKGKHFETRGDKIKSSERFEEYEEYSNVEFDQNPSKNLSKSQKHKQSQHNQSSGHGLNRTDNNLNNGKSRNRTDGHRKHSSNKGQHNRFEQQLPPRFLKQLKKKQEHHGEEQEATTNELTSSESVDKCQSFGDTPQHRGLIRLPASNQLSGPSMTNVYPNSYASGGHQIPAGSANRVMAGKPCVAIRPTQHVVSNPQYSPSSSPDTNALSAVDNYQQLSPYMRSNSEYAIPHFMSTASVESADNTRKKSKAIIEKALNEVMALENDLLLCINDQRKLEQIRWRIQLRYEQIILNDLRICAELNIEQKLWKSAFYQFIEHYRRLMEQNSEQQSELKSSLHKIIDEASVFFENLLVKMQETYGFVIEKLLAHEYDSETENYETLKLAAISAQKIYLYLGDLSRYRECETRNSNYVKSKFFYMRAQMLAPKNGRSYNQLAILANYQNRRLDAVYYYMRSLAASNPFWTARENLLAIFDEVRRKYELTEKKRKQDLINQRKKLEEELKGLKSDKERLEIWIRSDGTSAVCSDYKHLFEEESETFKEDLDSFSSVDLNKRFLLSFLHTHGKLFSRVGMETFIPVVNQMLAEFRSLLRRSPIPFMSQRLSQLLAINMFAVFNTSLKETSYGQNCRSLLQEQAIQVTLAMISLILECAIKSMEEQQRSQRSSDQINDDLSELLPTIKLWTDWMSCQKQLWCPPPQPSDFKGDVWTIFAQFLTLLTKINVRSVKLLGSKLEGCEAIILPEDTNLAGFLPLMGAPQCIQFAQPFYDKEKARTCLRITAIQYFGDYLCGIVEPYLKYDVEKKRYISLIPSSVQSVTDENSSRISNDFENSEIEIDEFSGDVASIESNALLTNELPIAIKDVEDMDVENLWSRQEILRKKRDRQEMIKQQVDAILSEENQRKPLRIVIQPRFVIPDTNCYIDHLDKIKTIVDSKLFELIVPLIVINELNGLKARGIRTAKPLTFSDDHIGNVAKVAAQTIDYLVSAFNDKSRRLKAITSKGSLLDNINFISESLNDSQGNSNDDLILNACLHFIEDKPLEKSTKESALNSAESNSIFREVVLLTDDRNLRVKALGHNVPVKGLKHFIKWANIPHNSNHD